MSEKDKLTVGIYKDLLDEIKSMHPEYIKDYIEDQISIIEHGI